MVTIHDHQSPCTRYCTRFSSHTILFIIVPTHGYYLLLLSRSHNVKAVCSSEHEPLGALLISTHPLARPLIPPAPADPFPTAQMTGKVQVWHDSACLRYE